MINFIYKIVFYLHRIRHHYKYYFTKHYFGGSYIVNFFTANY